MNAHETAVHFRAQYDGAIAFYAGNQRFRQAARAGDVISLGPKTAAVFAGGIAAAVERGQLVPCDAEAAAHPATFDQILQKSERLDRPALAVRRSARACAPLSVSIGDLVRARL